MSLTASFSFGHLQPLSPCENRLVRWRRCVGQVVAMMVGERRGAVVGGGGGAHKLVSATSGALRCTKALMPTLYTRGLSTSHGLGSALA